MNYEEVESPQRMEPDCSPHPFDIMAMNALYQTLAWVPHPQTGRIP